MNLYVRYFDQETLAKGIDEVIEFLQSISDIQIDQPLIDDIKNYAESDQSYPKRYKIRPRVYFIVIKTKAESLEEFKANKKNTENPHPQNEDIIIKKDTRTNVLTFENTGWYKSSLTFKRVMPIPGTLKFQYQDTFFSAYVYAKSGQDCYEKMVGYLKNRQDIDLRSQFPSAKGSNYLFSYLGTLQQEESESTEILD